MAQSLHSSLPAETEFRQPHEQPQLRVGFRVEDPVAFVWTMILGMVTLVGRWAISMRILETLVGFWKSQNGSDDYLL
jgi:hypothetical protein